METETSIHAELNEISAADWAATPSSVQQLLLRLIERLDQQSIEIAALKAEVAVLKAENAKLQEQVQRNSQNSSQPPSSDQGFKVSRKGKSGQSRGGQRGHIGHERYLYDVADCTAVHEHYPRACQACGGVLSGSDPSPYRHQVVEIPAVMPEVVEHRFHQLVCPVCETLTRAPSSAIVTQGGYGPRLSSLVVWLSGKAHQSHGQIVSLLDELFGVVLSTGMVSRLRQQFTTAMQPAMAAALSYMRQQPVLGMDETGWPQGNSDGQNAVQKRGWLWVMCSPWVSYFAIHLSRAQTVVKALLGPDYPGFVGSDRCPSYNPLPLHQRQICWAHLKRDFTAMAERAGVSAEIGQDLLDIESAVFDLWHDLRNGVIGRIGLAEQIRPLRLALQQILREAASFDDKGKTPLDKTARTCAKILTLEPALWTFVSQSGVEPTNNASERALRPAVLWRKGSFGSQSQNGAEFVATILTVITSLKAQNRPVLDYLTDVFDAAQRRLAIPAFLPTI
jgi:transposase